MWIEWLIRVVCTAYAAQQTFVLVLKLVAAAQGRTMKASALQMALWALAVAGAVWGLP